MKNVAVFGDAHGNASLLKKLIDKIRKEYGYDIEIWSCGDLIDRGGYEKEVVDLCLKENVKVVMGNHDQWVVELLVNQRFNPYATPIFQAQSTFKSYGVDFDALVKEQGEVEGGSLAAVKFIENLPEEHIGFFLNLYDVGMIDWLDDKKYWILHAGLQDAIAKKFKEDDGDLEMMKRVVKNSHNSILWIRPNFKGKNDNLYHFENGLQIFGHSYTRKPVVREHFVALDTIGHGREPKWTLSAVILPDKKIVQVTE